jgi:hypothetical protein
MTMHNPGDEEIYLGDGLFASFDGFMITLRASRENGDHFVMLEPSVFAALVEFQRAEIEAAVRPVLRRLP